MGLWVRRHGWGCVKGGRGLDHTDGDVEDGLGTWETEGKRGGIG